MVYHATISNSFEIDRFFFFTEFSLHLFTKRVLSAAEAAILLVPVRSARSADKISAEALTNSFSSLFLLSPLNAVRTNPVCDIDVLHANHGPAHYADQVSDPRLGNLQALPQPIL